MTAFMMNPSSADESCGDNTVNFMIKVAKYNNYGSLFVINTSPIIKRSKATKEDFINDIENYEYIEYADGISEVVVLGWGKNGQRYGI
ncbi:hypothetical protein COK44_17380 [Bacillus cereus]|nr:hypothetical protein COK44_17380 [Bacillus cereus]